MRAPVIVVTGAIASGKTVVARLLARGGGALVDCDSLAHGVFKDPALKGKLVKAFGRGILTPSGGVSRARLGRIVFSDPSRLDRLNRLVRPFVKKIITEKVRSLRRSADYIVLDAVLYFEYKFRFKVDLVILTEASVETRVRRMMGRDGFSREEAMIRIKRQEALEAGWSRADLTVRTDCSRDRVGKIVKGIRDSFFDERSGQRRKRRWMRK